MPEYVNTKAIMLLNRLWSESSRMVVMYTADLGKITVAARGSRKLKSGFGTALEPVTESDVMVGFTPGRDVHQLRSAEVKEFFGGLKASFSRSTVASACCELIDRAITDPEPLSSLYDALSAALYGLNTGTDDRPIRWFWWLSLQLVEALGYAPTFNECVSCGTKSLENPKLCYPLGGVLCGVCASAEETSTRYISPGGQKYLARLGSAEPSSVEDADVVDRIVGEITNQLEGYLKYHLPSYRGVKSLAMLESVVSAQQRQGS